MKILNRSFTLREKEAATGYAFMIPYLIGFLVFQGLPFLVALLASFTNMKFISTNLSNLRFVGIQNYINVLTDADFINACLRSLYYSALYVPAVIILSLVIAYFVNSKIYLKNSIKTFIFLPYVSNVVAVAMVWSLLYDYQFGPINMLLRGIGIENPPMWLVGDTSIVIPAIVIVNVWSVLGFFMTIYLAALQEIPQEMYEAAEIDGASETRKFFSITLPFLSPTTFFQVITAIIMSMQNFALIQSLTRGGPGNESTVVSLYSYNQAFKFYNMHIASTQSVYILVVLAVIALIQWRGQKRWTN